MNKLNKIGFLALFLLFNFSILQAQIIINELDADTPSTDAAEFVELAGPANAPLDGYVLVLFNGSNNTVYDCHDLDGYAIDANGFFVIGNIATADLGPTQDLTIGATNWLQNGADGVALYQVADCVSIPACPTGTTNLTDAIVYGTNDADATTLLSCLGETTQYNESSGGNPADESSQWDGSAYVTNIATPGAANNTTVICSISNAFLSNGGCVGPDYVFDVTFSEVGSSGSFKIVDITNTMDLVTGLAATTTTITLAGNTSAVPFDIVVQDEADVACASNTLTVMPIDCSFIPVCANVGELVITEIMHSPAAVDDQDGEYIELYNTTMDDIDIQGYQLEDSGANPHTIASSVIVPAMGYAVLGLEADIAMNGGYTPTYVYSGFTLGSSDLVQISCSGTVIDIVDFSNGGFPGATAVSLSLDMGILDATMNDDGSNWCVSSASTLTSTDLGTPGTVNPACPVVTCPSVAFISEFHYDDDGTDANELVEVAVPTGEDATGLTVTLYNGNNGASYSSYTLTAGDLIGSDVTYDYYVWYVSLQNGGPDGIALDCDGTLIEFLSYEGAMTATNGVANGVLSTDVGVVESSTGLDTESLQLIDGVWVGPIPATAGATNVDNTPPCAITDVTVTGACNGVDYEYTVGFTVVTGGGTYEIVDNTTMTVLETTTMTSATITIAASTSTTPFDVFVRDMADVACASATATVTPEDCSAPACPTDLTLLPTETGSMTYQVSNNITSTDVVAASEVVVYDAGNCIELPAEFTVELGAEFDAIIGGCTPAFTGENSDK